VLRLAEACVPVLPTVERAVAALGSFPAVRDSPAACQGPAVDGAAPRRIMGLEETAAVLGADWPWAKFATVASAEEVRAFGLRFGFPVVLKVAGRTLQHRSEVGGVKIGVTEANLVASYEAVEGVAAAHADAVLVQEQSAPGMEVMMSAVLDPEVGPIVFVRPGGVLTELIPGNAVIWHGWTAEVRRQRLLESTIGHMLVGYRGAPARDLGAVLGLVDQLLAALLDRPLASIELNPVVVAIDGEGLLLVDALSART
jgi:acetate---CoA ligase (ADP-forming)